MPGPALLFLAVPWHFCGSPCGPAPAADSHPASDMSSQASDGGGCALGRSLTRPRWRINDCARAGFAFPSRPLAFLWIPLRTLLSRKLTIRCPVRAAAGADAQACPQAGLRITDNLPPAARRDPRPSLPTTAFCPPRGGQPWARGAGPVLKLGQRAPVAPASSLALVRIPRCSGE